MRELVAQEREPLTVLTHLLRLCRDEHATLWEQLADQEVQAARQDLQESLRSWTLETPSPDVVAAELRSAMAQALAPQAALPPEVVAYTLAGFVDDRFAHTFGASFRRRSPYRPGVGDPIPVDAPDPHRFTAAPSTSPPWRLAQRLDETRHIRLAGEWAVQFRVVFDYSLSALLAGLVDSDTIVATCHPNRTMADFDVHARDGGGSFPVGPLDPVRQREEVDRLVGAAVAAGADIVALPELCVTPELARYLRHWVRRPDGPRLLVAGSYHGHRASRGVSRRSNTAVAWVRGHDEPLEQDKHSPADRPVQEDIQPSGWPQIHIHVSDDGWHLAMAVCRDLLNPHAVHALSEVGANLVFVPAMSESLLAFGSPAAQLVGSCQAIVVVANNPAQWTHPDGTPLPAPARALFGHPTFAQQTRFVHAPDDGPGVALLRVATAETSWVAVPAAPPPAAGSRTVSGDRPSWVTALAAAIPFAIHPGRHPSSVAPGHVQLRRAAVLLLLRPEPAGPTVLLTARSPDLEHYPGQLVFPGGASEPQDDGPAATALREAAEEVGLDPTSVEVLGCLPELADPDGRFLVTPVVAWATAPRFTGQVSTTEVSDVHFYSAAQLTDHSPAGVGDAVRPRFGLMTRVLLDILAARLASAS